MKRKEQDQEDQVKEKLHEMSVPRLQQKPMKKKQEVLKNKAAKTANETCLS